MTGAGNGNKNGTGTLILSGTNDFTGDLQRLQMVLFRLGSNTGLGATGDGTINIGTKKLQFKGGLTVAAKQSTTIEDGGTIEADQWNFELRQPDLDRSRRRRQH